MSARPKDFPFAEIEASCRAVVAAGSFIIQKWTCGGCDRRVGANSVNVLTHAGHCQHCGHVTDLDERGCNFTLIKPSRPMTAAEVEQMLGLTETGIQ